jgi:hypothetical protein
MKTNDFIRGLDRDLAGKTAFILELISGELETKSQEDLVFAIKLGLSELQTQTIERCKHGAFSALQDAQSAMNSKRLDLYEVKKL